MRTREIIKLMPTQYRQTTTNPLDSGHYIPMLGYWTKDEGYVKKQSLVYEGESLACPIIAVVNRRVGKEDLSLTITAKVSEYSSTIEKAQGDYTVKRKTYTPTDTTVQTTLTIPRFTRQWATFLLTGLGKMVYEITSVEDSNEYDTSKIEFYALASAGSRIIYWFGLHKITELLRDIVQGPWLAPTKCLRCSGTGIEPNTTEPCEQCLGYKYSGYNATRYIQRMKGFDVGLARKVLDWDNLTNDDHTLIKEFINKAWTQKWWVTPTKNEIKRLFAHFFQLPNDSIQVVERFHLQEPVWTLNLPRQASPSSPFGRKMYEEQEDLLKYVARSITPAGVSVFMGFYDLGYFGDFGFYTSENVMYHLNFKSCAFEQRYKLLLSPRWAYWNGWTHALDHFERCTGQSTGQVGGIWESTGQVGIANVNDQNRHMVKFSNGCYIQHGISGVPTGQFEFWIHPEDSEMRIGLVDNTGFAAYVSYKPQNTGFYDNWGNVIRYAMPHSDYHVRMDFVVDATGAGSTGQYGYIEQVLINKIVVSNGFNFIRSLGNGPKLRIQNTGQGVGFFDAYGNSWNATGQSGYNGIGDNWQRLYPVGWGICNRTHTSNYGLYKATYNFGDDDIGSVPDGWTDSSTDGCTAVIIKGAEGSYHKKVLKLTDVSATGRCQIEQSFSAKDYEQHIEYWVMLGQSNRKCTLRIDDGGTYSHELIFDNDGNIKSWDGDSLDTIMAYEINKWYHIRENFDGDGDWIKIYIDQELKKTDGLYGKSNSPDGFILLTEDGESGAIMYIDAVGYDWDTEYEVGDNLVPIEDENGLHDIYIRKDKFWDKIILD